jgi:CheY-like chemotaxis protein
MVSAADEKKKKRILLIDDDTSLLMTLSDFLGFEGYDVITADSGEAGLKTLNRMKPPPDLIVLDMSMPGMGGIGFLKRISSPEGKPRHPVLVLTARANMAEFFADVEVDGFVAKPCDPNDLLMEVGRIVFLRSGTALEGDAPVAAAKKTLILAEDRELLNQSLTGALAADYIVHAVAKGPEVIEKAILERPDGVVMRAGLGGLKGVAVANMLEQMPGTQGIPVVLYETTGPVQGANIRGVIEGCDPKELLKAVEAVFAREP